MSWNTSVDRRKPLNVLGEVKCRSQIGFSGSQNKSWNQAHNSAL